MNASHHRARGGGFTLNKPSSRAPSALPLLCGKEKTMQAVREDGIALTRCGQLRPYQDSVYAGTVDASNEAEARAKLAAMRHAKVILDKQGGGEQWSSPYFTQFAADGDGRWKFTIVEEYTG